MKNTLLVACLMIACSILAYGNENRTIIVSVEDRIETSKPFVVFFDVHSPKELKGTTFVINTKSKSRKLVRKAFPQGSLYSVPISSSVYRYLKEQAFDREKHQIDIDSGRPADTISSAYPLYYITIDNFPEPFVAIYSNEIKSVQLEESLLATPLDLDEKYKKKWKD